MIKTASKRFHSKGFTLIELLVVVVILSVATTAVSLQISKKPLFSARDDVRKTDINAIADAYEARSIDQNKYYPLEAGDYLTGKIPTPPEGGNYQGLLTEPNEYYFICAQLEKGKDINCLLNSENPNCYCRKSKNAPPIPSIPPSPTPTASPSITPSSTPIGVGTTSPAPTSSPTPTQTPTPAPSNPPSVYSDICPYQNIPQTKPSIVSLEGIDGTWCYDSDYIDASAGGLVYARTPGYCVDNNHNCADFCENNYPNDSVRDGYCSGTWWGGFLTNVHCEFGGYVCTSWGDACNEGEQKAYCDSGAAPLPSPSPLPEETARKRVFKTSTTYNGNLGGLTGADQKCQDRANTAGLGGVWKAWLSDGNSSASSRLNHFSGPYTLLDGTVVADNWVDLTDGTLDRNINMTEFKIINLTLTTVWTGTTSAGNYMGNSCLNWTVGFGWPYFGGIGSGGSTLSYWTQGASDSYVCSSGFLSLYCFEQ